ncbi:hypothetical protein HY497_01765 [Candidatus Woesearchaeota archaeon]|nr:hypothetical protein [Candidatus Woesearchaeota archaeon]
MTEIIAVLGSGKGTWAEVAALIKSKPWERVFLVTDDFGKEKFTADAEFIVIDARRSILELRDEIHQKLSGKIKGLEIALNMSSGSGKEHMALVGALMRLGVGFRIVTAGEAGFKEI